MFSLLQNQRTRGQNRFGPEAVGGIGGVRRNREVSKHKNSK
jgi:hypothetical protein